MKKGDSVKIRNSKVYQKELRYEVIKINSNDTVNVKESVDGFVYTNVETDIFEVV